MNVIALIRSSLDDHPIVRLAQAVEDTKRAHSEIEAEKLLGQLNRFHQSKALQYAAVAEQFAALAVKHFQKTNMNRTMSPVLKRRSRMPSKAA
jgi:hypothetical protein